MVWDNSQGPDTGLDCVSLQRLHHGGGGVSFLGVYFYDLALDFGSV